jgi:hypothetical protein
MPHRFVVQPMNVSCFVFEQSGEPFDGESRWRPNRDRHSIAVHLGTSSGALRSCRHHNQNRSNPPDVHGCQPLSKESSQVTSVIA